MTTQQRLLEWRDKWAGTVVLLVGYGLCKTLTLDSYVTAFGAVRFPMGYVSDVPFMLGASFGVLLVSALMLVWCRRRHRLDLPYCIPMAVLVLCYEVSLLPVGPRYGCLCSWVWCGGVPRASCRRRFWNCSPMSARPWRSILQLTCALVCSAALSLVLRPAPELLRLVIWPLIALACCLTVHWGRRAVRLRGWPCHGAPR